MADGASSSLLLTRVQDRFAAYKTQRADLVIKWENNRRAFCVLDPETGKRWKPRAEAQRDWHSTYVSDIGRQKTVTAHSIVMDALLKGGKLALMLAPDDEQIPDVAPPEGTADEATARAQAIEFRERRIHRQIAETGVEAELTTAVLLAAAYGESYLKRYVTTVDRETLVPGLDGAAEPRVEQESMPAVMCRPPQAIFRDLTRDDISQGTGIIDRDELGDDELRALLDNPIYDARAIHDVLSGLATNGETGGASRQNDSAVRTPRQMAVQGGTTEKAETLEYWGTARVKEVLSYIADRTAPGQDPKYPAPAHLARIKQELTGRDPESWAEVSVTVAADRIIRVVHTKQRSRRSFWRIVWERDPDGPGGVGVCDKLLHHHITLTGAVRAMEDNAKVCSNLMGAIKRRWFESEFDTFEPGKWYDVSEDCDDARKALAPFQFPDILQHISPIIESFLSFADLASMVPRVQQGQEVKEPQTAFELASRLEQAGKYLAGVIRQVDKAVEWIGTEYYRWNELAPDAPPMPYRLRVKALGFTSFENKQVRLTRLMRALEMTLSNEQVLALSKLRFLLEEIYKAMDIDPDQILKTAQDLNQEAAEREQAMAQAGGDPVQRQAAAMQIALLRAEARDLDARATLNEQKAAQTAEERLVKKAVAVRELSAPPVAQGPAGGGAPSASAQPAGVAA